MNLNDDFKYVDKLMSYVGLDVGFTGIDAATANLITGAKLKSLGSFEGGQIVIVHNADIG